MIISNVRHFLFNKNMVLYYWMRKIIGKGRALTIAVAIEYLLNHTIGREVKR